MTDNKNEQKDPNRGGLEASEGFRLIGYHFERAADLLDLGRADEAEYHYERGGYWASRMLKASEAVSDD